MHLSLLPTGCHFRQWQALRGSVATIVLALICGAPALYAQVPMSAASDPFPAFERGPVVEGIAQYTLKRNGLRVLLFPDASSPKVTVNITYLVGSRHEGYGETGMAHLLEHLLFKGTTSMPKLWQDLSSRGFIYNGTTWTDRTNYYQSFTANDGNLKWALTMEADRMVNSRIAREDLDTEMTVVRNEFEMGENRPQLTLYHKVLATAFMWHNYGNSTIGNRSDIENVGIDNLRAFYRTYYQPDNAVLLVAGKFDDAKTLGWIAESFGRIERPTRTLPRLWTVEPTQDGEREITLRRVGDSQILFPAYRVPAAAHADAAAIQVLLALMTAEPAGRLYQALVKSKLAVSVDAEIDLMHDASVVGIWAILNKTQSIERAREVLLGTLESAAGKPFTAAELARVKLQFAKNYDQSIADSARLAVGLSEAIAVGDWRFYFFHRDRIERVTLADVSRVAGTYFKAQNRTLGRFLPTAKPDRAEIAASPHVATLLSDYRGATDIALGEAFDPSPAHIEQRTERYTLPNGLKVALLPKSTRGHAVQMALRIGFGDEKSRAGKHAAEALASALMLRGATGMNHQQIRDQLDALRASGSLNLGGGAFQTKRAHLPALITLLGKLYHSPTFPADELELVRKEQITAIEESAKDPESVASTALERHFSPYPRGDVRYVPTAAEQLSDLKAVTRAEIVRVAAASRGLSAAEIAIVGDFDVTATKAALAAAFGESRLRAPFARITRTFKPTPPVSQKIATPDKENTSYVARTSFALRDSDSDYAALLLADFIIGNSDASRLWMRIREKEGLSYNVFSELAVPTFGDQANWTFGFIANPQNAARAEASLRDEIATVLRDGLSDEEFERQRQSLMDQRKVRRSRDDAIAAQLVALTDTGRTYTFVADLEARLLALTRTDIEAAIRKYLRPLALSSFAAGDFARVKH
ncbi:MAG: insulinase family protein [Burkholderiales bacterium]|nr:insulinase family protein [Burkholderiales bacterium]